MTKRNRVEVRLNDRDYQLLGDRAAEEGATLTETIEWLLHNARPTRVVGVREVGLRGRRRLGIRFSNGLTVHGFLWSRGGQLLPPQIPTDRGFVPIVNATPGLWRALREFLTNELGVENNPTDLEAVDEAELVGAHL